ncbi:integrase [Treponema phagedenis]|uniref:Integrase n=1 Tax=Treponema phagedenis TaxID=162 RepID=A0A0B7GV68_TREPH|nr:hypothetical protein HMPREF9554_02131 [Treponema phagedenis F0421]NVP25130.1 integrase [Treponema phagedenis]QEJ96094.1 integrase [Treponema phagedenis]QEJ97244.1 integrase [Treponema phagedenis]QEK01857.1 integrase [Treponema phagedenis]
MVYEPAILQAKLTVAYFAEQFSYSDELKMKLGKISSATIGRFLKPEIAKCSVKGISTTRPAKNLNQLIPIRTFFDWDERKPGFLEQKPERPKT